MTHLCVYQSIGEMQQDIDAERRSGNKIKFLHILEPEQHEGFKYMVVYSETKKYNKKMQNL